ncbi:unnamed protein product [Pylaiella littoralis]
MVRTMSISRFAAALLLVIAITAVQLQHAGAATSSDDPCVPLDLDCFEDAECKACRETASSNTAEYEKCIDNYVYDAPVCINQSLQPCCQNEASPTDCLANAAYVAFYECRLQNDVVDEECQSLSCDAVGTSAPTPVGGPVPETGAPTTVLGDDDTELTGTNGAGQLVPFLTKSNAATGAIALTAGLSAAVAAFI